MAWFNKEKVSNALAPVVEQVANTTLSFRDMLNSIIGVSHSAARDIYEIFGYKRNRNFQTYYEYYEYNDYGNRVVTALPKACWRSGVKIKDSDDEDVLEDELSVLFNRKMFKQLEAADILNRIGAFSVLYVGLPDGLDPEQPVGMCRNLDQVFFSAFSEDGITISEYEEDILSPRFNMPKIYTLQRVVRSSSTDVLEKTRPIRVHWTRLVHLAEGSLDSGLVGMSCLSPILNRLDDLNKSIGGASEAYFRNARGKLAYKADSSFSGFKSQTEKDTFDLETKAFTNGWKDSISLVGVDAKSIDTPHHDPAGTVKVALQAVSGQTGIPIRILTGEGAGQLAGNEDKASFNQLTSDRQNLTCQEWVERVFEILQMAGLLEYRPDYVVEWHTIESLEALEKSQVGSNNANAFKTVTEALASLVLDGNVDPAEIYKLVLDLDIDYEIDDENLGDDGGEPDPITPGGGTDEDLLNG